MGLTSKSESLSIVNDANGGITKLIMDGDKIQNLKLFCNSSFYPPMSKQEKYTNNTFK